MEGIEVIHERDSRVSRIVIAAAALVVLVIVAVALIVSQRGAEASPPELTTAVTPPFGYVNRGGYYTRVPSADHGRYVNRGGYYTLAP